MYLQYFENSLKKIYISIKILISGKKREKREREKKKVKRLEGMLDNDVSLKSARMSKILINSFKVIYFLFRGLPRVKTRFFTEFQILLIDYFLLPYISK